MQSIPLNSHALEHFVDFSESIIKPVSPKLNEPTRLYIWGITLLPGLRDSLQSEYIAAWSTITIASVKTYEHTLMPMDPSNRAKPLFDATGARVRFSHSDGGEMGVFRIEMESTSTCPYGGILLSISTDVPPVLEFPSARAVSSTAYCIAPETYQPPANGWKMASVPPPTGNQQSVPGFMAGGRVP